MAGICVTLGEGDTTEALARMDELAPVADLFEVRADLLSGVDLAALRARSTRPLLLTCRAASQGGRRDDADPVRRDTLSAGLRLGFDHVDVEHGPGLADLAAAAGSRLVLSHHDLEGTPADLDALYASMCAARPAVAKIVVTPRSFADVARLLAFAARARATGPVPLIALAMGPLGVATRVLAGRYGAPWTYASPAPGREAAPGQLDARTLHDVYRVRTISPATRVFGVLGADVSRSLSPALHNRAFAERALDAVLVPWSVDDLDAFWDALPSLDLAGFSVTRPYKAAVIARLDAVDSAAARMDSVNTVVRDGSAWHGFSTDGDGLLAPLRARTSLAGRRVVVLGAGGAARAAAAALAAEDAHTILLAREPARAAEAAAPSGSAHGPLARLADQPYDVLVNATPVGQAPRDGETLVPAALLRAGTIVFDMVTTPRETRLLREARAAGCVVIAGHEMLAAQGYRQFELWTRQDAPRDAMRAAVAEAAA
jgi:3-dehydroquinate dehydratase / shikimate dehydrogenase